MLSIEERLQRLEFHQKLLLEMLKHHNYPFYELAILKQLTEAEMNEVLMLCRELNEEFIQQQEEGYVSFTKLLTAFVGMLNPALDPRQTINALYQQGICSELMGRLKEEAANIID